MGRPSNRSATPITAAIMATLTITLGAARPIAAQPKRAFEIETRFHKVNGARFAGVRFPGGLVDGAPSAKPELTFVQVGVVCQQSKTPLWDLFVTFERSHPALAESRMTIGVGRSDGIEARTVAIVSIGQTLNTSVNGGDVLNELAMTRRKTLQAVYLEFGFSRIMLDAGTLLHALDVAGSYCRSGKIIDRSNPY